MADVTGGIGTAPPPGAPMEVSQPITDAAMSEMLAKARANERTLQPFNPKPEDNPAPVVVAPVEPNAAEKLLEAVRATQGERNPQPAASDSDSPSRGIPKPITDPGKVITGGFGNIGEAQYYPMTGLELAALVRKQMDLMNQRIENDLRFSMALTYPKIAVRLVLEVESYAQAFDTQWLEYIGVPEKQTPVEVAKRYGDKVVFVLVERRQEFDETGESVDAPDRIREELGLQVPRKQIVESGSGRQVVDVVPDIAESF